MPWTKRGALKGGTARRPRRRTSLARRFGRKRASASNNKRSVVTLARAVSRNSAVLRAQRIFTDYQYLEPDAPLGPGIQVELVSGNWYAWPITDVTTFDPVLRRDQTVLDGSSTYMLRMQSNFRVQIANEYYAYLNIWLVRPRKDAVSLLDDLAGVNPGLITSLTPGNDYIEGPVPGANIRLNPANFKCLASKQITLTKDTLNDAPEVDQNVGNPFSLWRKWQWTTKLNYRLRQPVGKPWRNLPWEQQQYHQKMYLLCYASSAGPDVNRGPFMAVDTMYTCLNSD